MLGTSFFSQNDKNIPRTCQGHAKNIARDGKIVMGRKSGRCSKQGLMGKDRGVGQRDLAFFTLVNGGIHLACPLVFCIL
jgi:hypothetical protein